MPTELGSNVNPPSTAADEFGLPGWGGTDLGGGGSSPIQPTGAGGPIPSASGSADDFYRRMMTQRRMPFPQSTMGSPMGGVDPQMVHQIMQHFMQLLRGGAMPQQQMPGQQQNAMGGMDFGQQMGSTGNIPHFAQGGIVNRP